MKGMKRSVFLVVAWMMCVALACAQAPAMDGPEGPGGPRGAGKGAFHRPAPFDPEQFEKNLEQFIATDACLTPTEAASFFPIYREMRNKLRGYFNQQQRDRFVDVCDDKACERIIRENDQRDVAMKKLQQEYHNRFLKIMPASKVFRIIRAEEKYHRQVFKRAMRHDNKRQK